MRKFTKIMVGVLSLSMMLGTIGGIGKPAMIVKADDTRQLVWSDEFNGTTLDPNTWNYDTGTGSGGWGNNEQEYYTNLPSNVSVSNGSLNITAIKQSYDGSNYTSGRINTQGKQEFKYGTIEARIKMPAGNGLWPAFWMLGANIGEVSWPRCGETDIMETIDGQSNVYGTVHWNASTGTAQLGSNATNIDVTQWHVYQIDWNPTSIVWSVDGVQYYSVNIGAGSDNMAAFQNKQFMVLNLAVGGNWPGNTIDDSKMPATMSVDYVRVYQTPEEAVGDYGTIQTDDSTNLLKNPNFKYGTQGWTTYVGDSWIPCSAYFDTTDPSVPNGMSLIMHNIGGWLETDSQWAIQLYQDGIPLQAGQSYSLKYQIHSNKDKNVSVYVTDEDTGATYYSGTYKINAYQTENMMVNLASIPNNITNAKVCFAVGAQGDDLATNSCDLSITQLKLATTSNIGTLTPITVPTITPLLATGTYASWKNTAITYPTAGQLVPAGPINVQWANLPNVTKSYSIYLDNNLISTVAPTSAATMTYQIYSTSVSQHELKIVANLTAGGTVTANLREFFISKKGMGTGANYIQDPALSWYYNWSTTPVVGFNPLDQWIPMIWGTGDYGTTFLTNPANKQYQAVLGYNEPDMASQSNVSVADAVAALPTFVNSGIRVGSPATATPICNSPWFSQYMTQAHANNLDVSFIAFHCYMATADPAAFLALIDSTYQEYGKPIWITEFGCADWTQNTFSGNSATAKAQVSAFMAAVLPALDSRPYVERYAWFPFDDTDQWGGASGLYDVGTGALDPLGLQYRSLGDPAGYILPQLDGSKPITDYPQDSIVNDTTGVITRPTQTNTVATPTITPASGTYTSAQSVTIADSTSGATIRYTTDGSTPTETNGTVYSGAFNVAATTTVNAIAYMSGSTDSAVASSIITISSIAGTNLALNKTATASSVNGANTAALAFDSDPVNTRWESVQGVDPQWIEVDLGANYSINSAKLVWETAAAKAYSIQVSTDNTNWTTVYSESNGTGGTENPTFAATTARYVRMYGTARTTGYGYSLWDFEVFGASGTTVATPTITPATGTFTSAQSVTIADSTSGATIRYTTDGSTPTETNGTVYSGAFNVAATTTVKAIAYQSGSTDSAVASSTITISSTTGTNLALNKTATASSVTGANTAALAFDSDPANTRWESAYSDPQWIEVDLGANYSINSAKLVWETAAAKAYSIQVSTDNTNWTTVYSETTGVGGTENPTFAATTARYVRMYGTVRTTGYGYSLWDFEVFGATAATVATPTITPATGTFTSAQSVTIADSTSGATIRYTTDGSTPTETNGIVYSGAFNVSVTTTVKAIAYQSGSTDSAVASSTITINLTTTNLALNKTATASSVTGANTAALAVDSNTTGTRWESAYSDPQWIEVDLGANHSITGATLVWETAAAKAYSIQVSTDNTNWTTVYSESNGVGGTENPTFAATTARYVRMYGTARTTGYGYSLWDFEVLGS